MDPIFIYNNNLIFDENQMFILNFSDGDVFKGVNFSKENDYYIMSMSCFIEVSNDITKLKQYDDIEKKSIIANRYIRNRNRKLLLSKLFSIIKPTNLRLIK